MDNIKDNSIIICNNSYKIKILKNIKKLLNIKFMTMKEFIKNYLFDYDEKAILYLINNYNLKYEIALEYLNNLYYIEDKLYNNKKLDLLVSIKKDLISNNLLIFNKLFKDYIKDKNIIIYENYLNKFEKYILNNLDNVIIINKEYFNYKSVIYEFNNIEEEVEYIAYSISKLINSGVDINNIKLANVENDYINVIEKIFNFYNLKINKHNTSPIISTIIGNIFFNNLDKGIKESIESIDNYKSADIYNKIIDICNKYVWCDNPKDLKTLIEYDLYNTSIDNIRYTNEIEIVDYKNYEFNDEYVFMLGFNQGIIPKISKDEDYINDSIKPYYLDTTNELNKIEKELTLNIIKSIKNLIITYKLKTDFNTFYPSNLIDDLNIEARHIEMNYIDSYSDISNKLKLASMLDNLIKFGEVNNNLSLLYSNYSISYNTYSNKFTGLNKNKLNNYIKNLKRFNLSYSAMDNYNRCAFRFYIDKILKLQDNLDLFSVILGNIYHDVLEKGIKSDINIEKELNNYIIENNIELSNSNKFFINRVIDNLKFLINEIKDQNKLSNLNNIETEKYISIPLKDNINFVGFIDKIMTNNDKTIGAIIDYKTYVKSPTLDYLEHGIGLQLPTYMYLAKSSYKDIRFTGFYLQNITLDNKSVEDKKKSLKLIGYTNKDKELLEHFDNNYNDDSIIDGLKINKDGSFSSNSLKKMLNDEEINTIITKTKEQIDKFVNNILDSKFDINPKYDDKNIGCEFCHFKDLCYMKEYNYEKIEAGEV